MGLVHYNHTAYSSIHEAWPIAHGYWLNHLGHCRKALGWCVTMNQRVAWSNEAGGGAENRKKDS